MKIVILAAFAAIFSLTNIKSSQAQIGAAHFRAWDQSQHRSTQRVKRAKVKRSKKVRTRIASRARHVSYQPVRRVALQRTAGSVVAHPAGCPRRLFCGCGASIEVFGRSIRHLWLARNWMKFPAAQPGPGTVAVSRRHVMVIRQYLGNGKAVVYDANSGGGRTRVHIRSIAGYSIRNPRA